MKKNFISMFQVSFMIFVAVSSFALSACSSDDDNTGGGNDSSMVSVKHAATGAIDTYHVIRADYTDYSVNSIAPSNEMIFSATLSEDKEDVMGNRLQFLIEQYKDSEKGQIKNFKSFNDLKVGSYLIISSRRLFYFSEFSGGDNHLYGASNPHGDVIVKSIDDKNLTLELKDFSFTNYTDEAETIINATIQYIPD